MTAPHPHTEEHPIDGGKSAFGKLTGLMVTAFIDMLGRIDRGEGALPVTAPKPELPAFTPPESANR